jgi:hypothetical protein
MKHWKALLALLVIGLLFVLFVGTVAATPPEGTLYHKLVPVSPGHPTGCMEQSFVNYPPEGQGWELGGCPPVEEPEECEDGYYLDENGRCVPNEEEPEECPEGYHEDDGQCVPDEEDDDCPEGYHAEGDTCVPDDDDTEEPPVNQPAPAASVPTVYCIDVFAPFLATTGFEPAAEGSVVGGTEWNGSNTDLTNAWFTFLDIVPEERDSVRAGNDAGMLCPDALSDGAQIIAFRVWVGDTWVTAGLVLVHRVGTSVIIDSAVILRPDILVPDPLWPGTWSQ